MKSRALALPLLLCLVAPLGTASLAASGPDEARASAAAAPIKRFVQLEDGLYRGAQPDEAGFRYLKDLGIRTIVSFRTDMDERALVESLGMRFVSIPVNFRAFGWGDDFDAEDVRQFFSVVDDPAAGPIFFHCKRGADRTGSFAAIYRIARQGWTEDKALQEARDRGMRWWYFPMRGQVKEYARQVQPANSAQ
jgi:protein tyrosine/serine phosphatase